MMNIRGVINTYHSSLLMLVSSLRKYTWGRFSSIMAKGSIGEDYRFIYLTIYFLLYPVSIAGLKDVRERNKNKVVGKSQLVLFACQRKFKYQYSVLMDTHPSGWEQRSSNGRGRCFHCISRKARFH